MSKKKLDYKKSGVDREKGDLFVQKITSMIESTYNARVRSGVGGFAALYDLDDERCLSSSTDGVGTKIKLAQKLGIHNSVGIDLVAMCANDLICNGSRPLFFLDYVAFGKIDVQVGSELLEGIVNGCRESSMALMGGETAEMPGLYKKGEYDLAGFCVGEISRKDIIDGKKIKPGDSLIGLASSGFHSNGYSLLRKVFKQDKTKVLKELLTPTKIYVRQINSALQKLRPNILGISHITGSGFYNIPRMNENFAYEIKNIPRKKQWADIFNKMRARIDLTEKEQYSTFNMGVGLVIATDAPEKLIQHFNSINETAFPLGRIVEGKGEVLVKHKETSFELI